MPLAFNQNLVSECQKKSHSVIQDYWGYSWLKDNMELGVSQLGSSASRGSKKVSNECQALGTCQDHAVTGWEVCDFVTHHSSTLETSQYRLTTSIQPSISLPSHKFHPSVAARVEVEISAPRADTNANISTWAKRLARTVRNKIPPKKLQSTKPDLSSGAPHMSYLF